eukprot:scaffold3884_cov392-Prasinococcus_capsulatus_cf.AAC.1
MCATVSGRGKATSEARSEFVARVPDPQAKDEVTAVNRRSTERLLLAPLRVTDVIVQLHDYARLIQSGLWLRDGQWTKSARVSVGGARTRSAAGCRRTGPNELTM